MRTPVHGALVGEGGLNIFENFFATVGELTYSYFCAIFVWLTLVLRMLSMEIGSLGEEFNFF